MEEIHRLDKLSMCAVVSKLYEEIKCNNKKTQVEKKPLVWQQNVDYSDTLNRKNSINQLSFQIENDRSESHLSMPKCKIAEYAKNNDIAPVDLIKMRLEGTSQSLIKNLPVIRQVTAVNASPVKSIPPTKSWVPINKNWSVKDENVLHNRPYLDDSDLEDDSVYHDLGYLYNGQVSGQRTLGYDMNDGIFIELMEKLTEKLCKTYEIFNRKLEKKSFDRFKHAAYSSINDMFPDFGDLKQLSNKHIELKSENTGITTDRTRNIDGPNAEDLGPKKALDSYRRLFCKRCFKYDCLTHPPDEKTHPGPPEFRKGPKLVNNSPCGTNCYMKIYEPPQKDLAQSGYDTNETNSLCSADSSGDHPKTRRKSRRKQQKSYGRKSKGSSKENTPSEELDYAVFDEIETIIQDSDFIFETSWTNGEKTIARGLMMVFQENYCAIARALMTKKCIQVYKFFQTDSLTDIDAINSMPFLHTQSKNKTSYADWRSNFNKLSDTGNTPAYIPCNHPGNKCKISVCQCVEQKSPCEKFCLCCIDCKYRFPGCNCKHDCKSQSCPCFVMNRECDPDLCKNCGAGITEAYYRNCKNVEIQYHENAETLIGRSTITKDAHGKDLDMWGLFSKEDIDKDSLISEYCGEVITEEDGEKRGILYDRYKLSYIFRLNSSYDVDATRKGNKIRFANHSNKPNCYAKIFLVNGDHRIGIYAKKDIEAGSELFFDYGDHFREQHKLF